MFGIQPFHRQDVGDHLRLNSSLVQFFSIDKGKVSMKVLFSVLCLRLRWYENGVPLYTGGQ